MTARVRLPHARRPSVAVRGASPRGAAVSASVVSLALGLVTLVVLLTGGAPNPLVHLYYIPILYAAARHGHLGALTTAVAAGLASGPWMPSSHGPEAPQSFDDWGMRLVLMVLISLVASWLASQDPRPLDLLLRDVFLGQGLRSAVRLGTLRVHYQPLVNLRDGTVMGVEALCRWNGRHGRPVAPDIFIPAAEHTGAIVPLGREVLRLSTLQGELWAAQRGAGMTMSVNVSAVQLSRPDFLAELERLAGGAAARHYTLCIEITETALLVDRGGALRALKAARAMGVLVAIDDFGTGQSSFSYLAGFPIDIIKIDQSFVAGVDSDATPRALVSAIVGIAASLGAITIAEGIETSGQLQAVRALGCDIGQGYFLGRPTEPADVDWAPRAMA